MLVWFGLVFYGCPYIKLLYNGLNLDLYGVYSTFHLPIDYLFDVKK